MVIAIVPIRHNSQRVVGKNYRNLAGKPLFHYILETLLRSDQIELIVIDTDSPVVINGVGDQIKGYQSNRVLVLERQANLCGDSVSMNQIIASVIRRLRLEGRLGEAGTDSLGTVFLQTHVTNPFLKLETIDKAIEKYLQLGVESRTTMISVTPYQKRLWTVKGEPVNHRRDQLLQTQDLDSLYEENSNFYLFRGKTIEEGGNRIDQNLALFEMSGLEAWDIDTEEDFRVAQAMMSGGQLYPATPYLGADGHLFGGEIDPELLLYLQLGLNKVINSYGFENIREKLKQVRVMISAPYMMSQIETFKWLYLNFLGVKSVIVAEVEERLSEEDLQLYDGLYDIALVGDDAFTREAIERSGVKAICKWGTGIDSIETGVEGVTVYNTPNAFTVPVAQSIMSAILGFARQTFSSQHLMKVTNSWVKLTGRTLSEMTVGIVGVGNIGTQVAKYLTGFEVERIVYYEIDPERKLEQSLGVEIVRVDSLNQLLGIVDVVCLCSTLNPTSRGMVNLENIKLVKDGSYLINMARGPLVTEEAVCWAIENGKLAGVALDVFEQEPLSQYSKLRFYPNVVISSHNSNSSPKYWNKVHLNTIKNSLIAINQLLVDLDGD